MTKKSRWAWEIARVAGIPIRVHATFLLLVAWVAYLYAEREATVTSVGLGVGFLLVVFFLVVLHELSHALTARVFGIGTRDITLWPIGGISSLERMPENPLQEFLVAMAGPALNVALALVLGVYLVATAGWSAIWQFDPVGGPLAFLDALLWVNVMLAAFNLLPAFPMDGGRALRALLSLGMDRVTATRVAGGIGKGMALLFGFVGLMYNPFLVLIAVFVWLGAGAEETHAELNAMLRGRRVAEAMTDYPASLLPGDSLERAARVLISGPQRLLPVFSNGRVVGLLDPGGLLRGLARLGGQARVEQAMEADPIVVHPQDDLPEAFRKLEQARAPGLVVVDGDRVVGVLTLFGIQLLVGVLSALSRAGAGPESPYSQGYPYPESPARPGAEARPYSHSP